MKRTFSRFLILAVLFTLSVLGGISCAGILEIESGSKKTPSNNIPVQAASPAQSPTTQLPNPPVPRACDFVIYFQSWVTEEAKQEILKDLKTTRVTDGGKNYSIWLKDITTRDSLVYDLKRKREVAEIGYCFSFGTFE